MDKQRVSLNKMGQIKDQQQMKDSFFQGRSGKPQLPKLKLKHLSSLMSSEDAGKKQMEKKQVIIKKKIWVDEHGLAVKDEAQIRGIEAAQSSP